MSPMYVVIWTDDYNSVQRKGPVVYNGKTVFDTLEEAQAALDNDRTEEMDYNPKHTVNWTIVKLPEGEPKA